MVLNLNETPQRYKEFYGRNTEQMPLLIAEGRVPLSVAGLMQARLDIRNSCEEVKAAWMNNYFDTGDAVVYHPDGRLKVVLDSQHLRGLTPKSELRAGALVLANGKYESLQGQEFTREELREHVGYWLNKKQAKAHPIWGALAGDQGLLDEYVDYIFAEVKERSGYDFAMGVYPDSAVKTQKMRAWFVGRLGDWSDADGESDLGIIGRLVGLLPRG